MKLAVSIFLPIVLALAAHNVCAQSLCFSEAEANKLIDDIRTDPPVPENKKVRKELLDMLAKQLELDAKIAFDVQKNQGLAPESADLADKNLFRICQIVKEIGWPGKEAIKDDGVEALTILVRSSRSTKAQRELIPVLTEASKKGYIGKALIAALVDEIRTSLGYAQIFGTQAIVRSDVIYLYPLIDEAKVEDWRKEYELNTLTEQIHRLEAKYALPVLRTHLPPKPGGKQPAKDPDLSALGISKDESEPVTVETKIVNLNVRILTKDLKAPAQLNLTKDDFAIVEDGVEQEPAFFSTADKPFDLVLILDFSGSTAEKRGMIKKAAQRFVQNARAQDRISIIAFADKIETISDLTEDKASLAEKIKKIELDGISPIWSAMALAYKGVIDKQSSGRRTAIVIMTDGLDNSPDTTFSDVLETVRRHEATIYPVYLDIDRNNGQWYERFRRQAQLSLSMLAEDSGGQVYKVNDLKDLNGIYEQVVNDLGKVFSLGYEPKNEVRDGGWRNLTVTLKTQTGLVAKTRRGYYAN